MPASISLIICTYNRCESLAETLQSLQQVTAPGGLQWELIVVDNNSKDSTKQTIEKFIASGLLPLRYVFESRPGLSFARNMGIEQAKGEIIVFTDDDVTFDKSWLVNVSAAFEKHACIAIGGRIYPVWPGPKPAWFEDDGPYSTPKAIVYFDLGNEVCVPNNHPYGANMAFRREAFEKYGNFRVDLGRTGTCLMGGEDIEFFQRLKNASERVLYIPDAVVHHPVTKDRMEQRYFQSWCFNAARSAIRLDGPPTHVAYLFGFPRHYFRNIVENFVKYLVTFEPKRRFFYKLQVYITAGSFVELRNLAKRPTA